MSKNRQFGFGLALAWLAFLVCFHTPIRQRKSPGVSLFFLILWDACDFLNKMVNSRQDAEDLAQDTFVKAYKNIHRFDPKYKFTTWLFTIAKRTAMNHYRSKKSTVELTPEKEIDERDPSIELEEKDQAEGLWDKAKRLLKPNQYDALWLRYGEGFSIGETANVMQTNELRVRVILHRARNKMAKHLTSQEASQ